MRLSCIENKAKELYSDAREEQIDVKYNNKGLSILNKEVGQALKYMKPDKTGISNQHQN